MKNLVFTLAVLFLAAQLRAQVIYAITTEGEKVILEGDGTWHYENTLPEEEDNAQPSDVPKTDCAYWITAEKDKMTGRPIIQGKEPMVVTDDGGKTGFVILPYITSLNTSALFISVVGGTGCVKENAGINFLFTDGSRAELINHGGYDCTPKATLYLGGIFGVGKKNLDMLTKKKVEALRVWVGDGYVQKDFTEENQEQFFWLLNCISKVKP